MTGLETDKALTEDGAELSSEDMYLAAVAVETQKPEIEAYDRAVRRRAIGTIAAAVACLAAGAIVGSAEAIHHQRKVFATA